MWYLAYPWSLRLWMQPQTVDKYCVVVLNGSFLLLFVPYLRGLTFGWYSEIFSRSWSLIAAANNIKRLLWLNLRQLELEISVVTHHRQRHYWNVFNESTGVSAWGERRFWSGLHRKRLSAFADRQCRHTQSSDKISAFGHVTLTCKLCFFVVVSTDPSPWVFRTRARLTTLWPHPSSAPATTGRSSSPPSPLRAASQFSVASVVCVLIIVSGETNMVMAVDHPSTGQCWSRSKVVYFDSGLVTFLEDFVPPRRTQNSNYLWLLLISLYRWLITVWTRHRW